MIFLNSVQNHRLKFLFLNENSPFASVNLYNVFVQSKLSVMQAYRMEKLFHSMRALNASRDYDFSSVDRLFVSSRLPLQKCVADVFKDDIHKMDFVIDPELARMYINNWVANQTNDQIKDLIPTSRISHKTRLVMVNIPAPRSYQQTDRNIVYNVSC